MYFQKFNLLKCNRILMISIKNSPRRIATGWNLYLDIQLFIRGLEPSLVSKSIVICIPSLLICTNCEVYRYGSCSCWEGNYECITHLSAFKYVNVCYSIVVSDSDLGSRTREGAVLLWWRIPAVVCNRAKHDVFRRVFPSKINRVKRQSLL